MIPVHVGALGSTQLENGAYGLILTDEHEMRCMFIMIGAHEAWLLRNILINVNFKNQRPLPQEHVLDAWSGFGYRFAKLEIDNVSQNIFFSTGYWVLEDAEDAQGLEGIIAKDMRPSDGLFYSIASDAPIYVDKALWDAASQLLDSKEEDQQKFEEFIDSNNFNFKKFLG